MARHAHAMTDASPARRVALVLGALAVLVLVAWAALLRSGGEDAAAPESERLAVATAPTDPFSADEDDDTPRRPGRPRVETFEVFAAKDPFQPAVRLGAPAAAAEEPGEAAPSGSSEEQIGGHRVRVVAVLTGNGRPRAQIQVDSVVHTVREGEVFADNFKLLSVSGSCATMLFGDDQFTLCEGEELLK